MNRYIPNRYAVLLLFYCFGTPGIIVYDTNNLMIQSGFNIDRVLELGIFGLTSFIFLIFLTIENRKILAKILNIRFGSIVSLILLLFLIYIPITLIQSDEFLAFGNLFRILEWIVCILLSQAAIVSLCKIQLHSERYEALRMYVFVFCFTPILMAIMGFIIGTDTSLFRFGTEVFRFGGQFFNPIYLSYFCIVCMAIIVSENRLSLRKIILLIILIVVIYFTKTRQSVVAALIFIGLLTISSKIESQKQLLVRALILFTAVLATIASLLLLQTILHTISRNGDITELFTLNNRSVLWKSFFDNFRITIFGDGYITGGELYGDAILDETGHWRPTHPHNEFMNLYLSGGMMAVFMGALIYGRVLADFLRYFNNRAFPIYISLGLFAVLIFQIVTPLFSHTLNIFGCFAILVLVSISNYRLLGLKGR